MDRLGSDLVAAAFEHGVRQGFWRLEERLGDKVFVWLVAPDARQYLIELTCDLYGDQAILGRFVEPSGRRCVNAAWPQGDARFEQWIKFKGTPTFICWDQDRDGLAHHPDWKGRQAWRKGRNQVVAYLDFLRQRLWIPANGYILVLAHAMS